MGGEGAGGGVVKAPTVESMRQALTRTWMKLALGVFLPQPLPSFWHGGGLPGVKGIESDCLMDVTMASGVYFDGE